MHEVHMLSEKIKLRLNPVNDKEFVDLLNQLISEPLKLEEPKATELESLMIEISKQGHLILKKEWE